MSARVIIVMAVLMFFRASAQTWEQTTAPSFNYPCIACSADGTTLLTSGFRVNIPIYSSTNSGATWTVTSAPLATWNSIASTPDGAKLVGVDYGGLVWTSTDGGATWISNNVPRAGLSSVDISSDVSKLVAVNVSPETIFV